jgi:hypothetical protein
MRRTHGAAVILGIVLAVPGAAPSVYAANLSAGNGVYQIKVSDGQLPAKCGVWAASTGPLHPAGNARPLFGALNNQFPLESSFTTFHSYASGLSYTTSGACQPLCVVIGRPAVTPIVRDGTTVGYRLAWTFHEPGLAAGPLIEFAQEVVVEGPVDGTQTAENSLVRETHVVTNHGPGRLAFGLRKLRDLLVGEDWGPWLGDCAVPAAACDVSMYLSRFGAPLYPRNVVLHAAPPAALCPAGISPVEPAGCDAAPSYIVATTVQPPTTLVPRPHPPELLEFNSWGVAAGPCWGPGELQNDAECGIDDANCHPILDPDCGTALSYHYGLTPRTAPRLLPGESREFSQYLAAAVDGCPAMMTAAD